MQRMPGYIKILVVFILSFAITMPFSGSAVSAALDDGNQSVESYFKNKDSEKKSGNTDKIDNSHNSETDKAETSSTNVGVSFGDIFRMFFALLFVSGLLYILFRIINKKNRGYQRGQLIENMGGAPLGSNRSVQVVRIGEKIYILGVGDSVQLLNVIEDEKEFSTLIAEHNDKLDQQIDPKDIFTKLLDKWRLGSNKQVSSSFSSELQDQLDHLKKDRKKIIKEISKKGTWRDE